MTSAQGTRARLLLTSSSRCDCERGCAARSRANADDAERDRGWFEWLYEKAGRAGGVERALFAERDEFGRFAGNKS
jgi:hypothetical protein